MEYIKIEGEPYQILESSHIKMGRGQGIYRTKLKNLLTGSTIERTFKGSQDMEETEILRKKAEFLYSQNDLFFFMDPDSYNQFELGKTKIGQLTDYLTENCDVDVLYFEGQPINISLPSKATLKIKYTEPGVKGNRIEAGTKPAVLETGAKIQVPLFIKEGDAIVVNTQTGKYVERAK